MTAGEMKYSECRFYARGSSGMQPCNLVLLLEQEQGSQAHLVFNTLSQLGRAGHGALRLAKAVVAVHAQADSEGII